MMNNARILSTRKLLANQKQFLLNSGLSVVEADFIKIRPKDFVLDNIGDCLIFTSANAVRSVLLNADAGKIIGKPCFCVGEKTKAELEKFGFEVVASANYASELAEEIKQHKDKSFSFFCGNLRMETLPMSMKISGIRFNEIEVYETVPNPMKINALSDAILFFSPSGVDSYLQSNEIRKQTCFCIGTTTAKALESKTNNIVIANKPTVENVIVQCINHYKTINVR